MKTLFYTLLALVLSAQFSVRAQDFTHFKVDDQYVCEYTGADASTQPELYDRIYGGTLMTADASVLSPGTLRYQVSRVPQMAVDKKNRTAAQMSEIEFEIAKLRVEESGDMQRVGFDISVPQYSTVSVDIYQHFGDHDKLWKTVQVSPTESQTLVYTHAGTAPEAYSLEVRTTDRGYRTTLLAEASSSPSLKLYPNPTSLSTTLEVPLSDIAGHIEVVDMSGRVLGTQQNHSALSEINLKGYAPGNYLIRSYPSGAAALVTKK